jgi:hypothetical protein
MKQVHWFHSRLQSDNMKQYGSNNEVGECSYGSNNLRSSQSKLCYCSFNPFTYNDPYRGSNATLTSKLCILYIYSTNIGTEYFKCGIYSPFFHPQNAVCFIILTYLVPVLFTFNIQGVLKFKKNNSGAKRLIRMFNYTYKIMYICY